MFPTGMFASATQRKILRILAEKNKRYTIEELAEACHRSPASISRALQHAEWYPFIEKSRVQGSKKLTFRLDPDSRYTGAIREFFEIERDRERQNGTVPVDVWNLVEDVTEQFTDTVEGFIELFLFGSYATGDYYAGSDIDLLLAHTATEEVADTINTVMEKVGDDRLHVIPVEVSGKHVSELDDETLLDEIRERSPVSGVDVVVPLTGEVTV